MTETRQADANGSFERRLRLDGRVALITGAAGGIGSAVGAAMASLGASVAVCDLDAGSCDKIAAKLNAAGGDAAGFAVNLEQEPQVRALPAKVAERFAGKLDILVNCAALVGTSEMTGWVVPFAEQTSATWRRALEVNLTAPFELVQEALPLLKASSSASVVNVASIYGVVGPDWRLYEDTPIASPAGYAASKGGLVQMTRWLATTLAPDVRVNTVSPGGVLRGQPDPFPERYAARTPMRRMATDLDVVGAIVFLAGDLASYVTGQNIMVDGGWTAW